VPLMDQTRTHRILLVSQSPRRRRLLELLGLPFETAAVDTPEELDSPLASNPAALAEFLAAEKAIAARAEGLAEDALVLTFDTIVVHEGELLGKPMDAEDARNMLRSLSGQVHQVVTGVGTLCPDDHEPSTFSVVTDVRMCVLDETRIEEWMASGEYMGCAGAYNIEGQVAEVTAKECYQNVAGLPLCHLYAFLTGPNAPTCLPATPRIPVAGCNEALGRVCAIGCSVTDAPGGRS
jgi:septum formation protein